MPKSAASSRAGVDVVLEVGARRSFASALDWPGWCRSGKSEEQALEALAACASRYAAVPLKAGVPFRGLAGGGLQIVERVKGNATTDFGAPGLAAQAESEPLTPAEVERLCALVSAAWEVFDATVKAAPGELAKGPRGGGRDRDKIVDHVLGAEVAYASKLSLKLGQPARGDRAAVNRHRDAILGAFRAGANGKPLREGGWTSRYAARRIAWHAVDHTWEIEDRSPKQA